MFEPGQIVLVDTNVVLEAHRVGCWASLAQFFSLHTVEKVIEETQTGYQNRSIEEEIDPRKLRSSFRGIVEIDDLARAEFLIEYPETQLDPGERDLAIYAAGLDLDRVWWLNSPDNATLRHAKTRGWLDRLVSLEAMGKRVGQRPAVRGNFTQAWLEQKRLQLRF